MKADANQTGERVGPAVLRLGISSALADYQPLRITRCAQTDVQRLKRRRRNPPILASRHDPLTSLIGWRFKMGWDELRPGGCPADLGLLIIDCFINRCAQIEILRLKRRRRNPPILASRHDPLTSLIGWRFNGAGTSCGWEVVGRLWVCWLSVAFHKSLCSGRMFCGS